jgi:hypothetical protein
MGITVHVAILQMYIWKTIFFAYKINYPGAERRCNLTRDAAYLCTISKYMLQKGIDNLEK